MVKIDTHSPVLVTGATGYVAGWLIKKLLEAGVKVHATVRCISDTHKYAHLDAVAAQAKGSIQYFEADLLQDGSYESAMKDCSIVFHTASPFILRVQNPQKDLIDPAKLGTKNVLIQASKTPSVRRVVLTSSCAAIYGDNIDLKKTRWGVFTEKDWNTTSSIQHNPYAYSKTIAERTAWEIAEKQDQWRLVVVNPSLVMGPALNPKGTSESYNLIRQIGDGTVKSGIPNAGLGFVDVRDVAQAHVAAAYLPDAKGRHIICAHNTNFAEISRLLLPHFGNFYPIPRKTLPKWLVWLVGPMVNESLTRTYVSRNINHPWIADNLKSIQALGLQYRCLSETMHDFFQQMIDSEQLNKQKS